ncbi:MAG TPA: pyridoxamine 5'-phosphate oxidase family protein [Azospirillaceae bacterium]|nr:pyridoxamine 5'-phosphate oxidase family protein [Azospirillaceae bacterium]
MDAYSPTPRTQLKRLPTRGSHDRAVVHAILDEAPLCHVGFVRGGSPVVIPTTHWRMGEELFIHMANKSHMMRELLDGAEACVTVSLIDGWVLARSAFHHSVNYRSVVVFGRPRLVTDAAEKRAAFDALIEKIAPGRSAEVRPPNEVEMRATAVLAFPLDEVSAKTRSGPPKDDAEDMTVPVWAGVVPLSLAAGTPIPDETAAE